MRRRAGASTIDEAWLASRLEERINVCQDQIRVEQALRSVMVASSEAETVRQPTATAQEEPAPAGPLA